MFFAYDNKNMFSTRYKRALSEVDNYLKKGTALVVPFLFVASRAFRIHNRLIERLI